MVKLLIIADDFTGALDTGIQFVNKGIATQVFTKMPEAICDIDESTEVLVIDSETRPMPAAKAYDAVKNITGWAKAINIPVIFKRRTQRSAEISEVSFRQFWTEAGTTKFISCRGIRR